MHAWLEILIMQWCSALLIFKIPLFQNSWKELGDLVIFLNMFLRQCEYPDRSAEKLRVTFVT